MRCSLGPWRQRGKDLQNPLGHTCADRKHKNMTVRKTD
uniref:Uncharacterized protein n=1 Tax=Anguilla anguilla TaxID=7936 RepID=A0A0E9T6T5_ANGAN